MKAAGKRQRRVPNNLRSSDDTKTPSAADPDQQRSKPGRRRPSARAQQPAAAAHHDSSEDPTSDEDGADSDTDDCETGSSADSETDEDADISDGDDDHATAVGQHDLCRWACVAESSKAFWSQVIDYSIVNHQFRCGCCRPLESKQLVQLADRARGTLSFRTRTDYDNIINVYEVRTAVVARSAACDLL